MRDVVDHQRLVHIHLEIAAGATKSHRDVVGHDLHSDHRQRLGLSRVDLPRHDGRAGLVRRNFEFRETGARTTGHQPDVVGDLVKRDGQRAQRARKVHERIVGALHRKLVRRCNEGQRRELRDLGRGGFSETGRGIEAGAHRGAAERQAVNAGQRGLEPLEVVGQHPRIARPFLAERQRHRVLHMGAADLDDVVPFLRFGGDRVVQRLHGRHQPLRHTDRRRDVHRRWERVIRRLAILT